MPRINELLTKEELGRIAAILGLKQEALKEYTLQKTQKAFLEEMKDLQILEDEKTEEAKSLFSKLDNLTEQDWKDSLDNDTDHINTANLENSSTHFVSFGPDERGLLEETEKVYTDITGRKPEYTRYDSLAQLENDSIIPESIKRIFLSKPFSPFILARLTFDNQEQYNKFLDKVPTEVKDKFNAVTGPSLEQTGIEKTQQHNYSTPSPFNLQPTRY